MLTIETRPFWPFSCILLKVVYRNTRYMCIVFVANIIWRSGHVIRSSFLLDFSFLHHSCRRDVKAIKHDQFGRALNGDTFWPPNRSFHGFSGHIGWGSNKTSRQRAIESLMIKRRASLPSFNFRFVQEQESISIAKKDKTLIKVSDLFSRRKTFSSLRFMGTLGSFSLNLTSRLLRGRPNVRTFEVCFHIL